MPALTQGSPQDWSDLEVLDPDHPLLKAYQEDLTRFLQEEDRQLTLKMIHQVASLSFSFPPPPTPPLPSQPPFCLDSSGSKWDSLPFFDVIRSTEDPWRSLEILLIL